jgi:hypothetical protein
MLQNYDYLSHQPYLPVLGTQPVDQSGTGEGVVPVAPEIAAEDDGQRLAERECSPEEYNWMLLL